jgi:hypothetical protein
MTVRKPDFYVMKRDGPEGKPRVALHREPSRKIRDGGGNRPLGTPGPVYRPK